MPRFSSRRRPGGPTGVPFSVETDKAYSASSGDTTQTNAVRCLLKNSLRFPHFPIAPAPLSTTLHDDTRDGSNINKLREALSWELISSLFVELERPGAAHMRRVHGCARPPLRSAPHGAPVPNLAVSTVQFVCALFNAARSPALRYGAVREQCGFAVMVVRFVRPCALRVIPLSKLNPIQCHIHLRCFRPKSLQRNRAKEVGLRRADKKTAPRPSTEAHLNLSFKAVHTTTGRRCGGKVQTTCTPLFSACTNHCKHLRPFRCTGTSSDISHQVHAVETDHTRHTRSIDTHPRVVGSDRATTRSTIRRRLRRHH